MNGAAGHYQKFKPKPGETIDETTLYIERRYDLKRLPPGIYSYEKDKPFNAPALVLENFVDALNQPANPKIPHTVVILWNDYRFWNDDILLQNHFGKILHKFFKELRKVVEIRNFALLEKAANWDNPRIFVSKPLPLPNGMAKYPHNFKANRRKFLKLLHKSSKRDNFNLINFDQFSCENKNHFLNHDGSISDEGYNYLWLAISDKIQESDKKQETQKLRIKAKQLASTDTTSESPNHQSDEMDGIWDIDSTSKNQSNSTKQSSPVRRSLKPAFDRSSNQNLQNQPEQSSNSSQARNRFIHHKFKRPRGRGGGYCGPPPPTFFPFNPFFPGMGYNQYPRGGKRGHYGPY